MPALAPTPSATTPGNTHVVFSAECIPAFDWQSCALFYSFYRVKQPGRITRLLACSEEQLASYPKSLLEMGPTFVHANMRFDHVNDIEAHDRFHDAKAGHGYASYNKPYSVHAFLEANTVEEEYIIMVDTDMFFRARVDPHSLGVRHGNVVSAEYTYLYGTKSGFANRFIAKELHPRLAQVGGFHIFHREDIRVIAPRWLEYTKRVRAFANMHPDEYFNESIQAPPGATPSDIVTLKRQARWHGEMYGYVFAAAEAGVTHRIRRDVMLYPGYEPYLGRAPSIMHYGSDFTLGRAYFNKMSHQQLKLETCPNFLLDDPGLPSLSELGKKEALSFEHLATLNAAFCRFYAKLGCALPPRCGDAEGRSFEQQIAALQPALDKCEDDHDGCGSWATSGECENNPLFMHAHCAVACKSCGKRPDDLHVDDTLSELGDWRKEERVRHAEQLKDALAFVSDAADEDSLDQLTAAIEKRRDALSAKHEL